jgi:nucleotide-binding universal stress UspA family protein
MFKNILFPTDFSDVSKKALSYIKKLKDGGAETVILIHVIDQRLYQSFYEYNMVSPVSLDKEMTVLADKGLKKIEDDLIKSGLKVKTLLQIGFPVREILKAEKEEDISVIVIGSHGKSNLEEMFLGSVSEKVVRKCKKPVFVIKR